MNSHGSSPWRLRCSTIIEISSAASARSTSRLRPVLRGSAMVPPQHACHGTSVRHFIGQTGRVTTRDESKSQHPAVVVVYLVRDDGSGPQVLLGEKRRGLGTGRLVGPGGKREPGESAVETAVREVFEEVGLRIDAADLEARGTLDYRFPYRPSWSQVSDVFVCRRWQGTPSGSDELVPRWIPVDAVPYDAMWDDAGYWLPGVLRGGSVRARFSFAEDNASVAGFTGTGVDGSGRPGVRRTGA
ncbi:8-oxo-dGTP diphosphatase [Curtobacterium pusillum]|uniref:Oxidized purine nucleoside triphosphate hydrolase n=1 Tax=Curtobacterium pusillum TaxID=69373 RepID=A0ABX2MD27_9MICO|nr:8-oxo-dGTP diphosphatase [Curtobacterium pusillum]